MERTSVALRPARVTGRSPYVHPGGRVVLLGAVGTAIALAMAPAMSPATEDEWGQQHKRLVGIASKAASGGLPSNCSCFFVLSLFLESQCPHSISGSRCGGTVC